MSHKFRPINTSAAVPFGLLQSLVLEPPQELLGPLISAGSIGMLAGPRGTGKSLLAMAMGYATTGKKNLEPWGTGSGHVVCYFDGEMRLSGFRERLLALHARNLDPASIAAVDRNLFIVSRDHFGDPIGSIDSKDGQQRLESLLPPSTAIAIFDNLSAWTSGGREDSTSWAQIKPWLIGLRLKGIAVLLIHHAGKNGQQRGSSAHEDLLDYSILLQPVADNSELNKTRFIVQHTKLRDHIPELKQDYEYEFWNKDGMLMFDCKPAGVPLTAIEAKILQLYGEDPKLSQSELAKRVGCNKSTVSRVLKRLSDSAKKGQPQDGQNDEDGSESAVIA